MLSRSVFNERTTSPVMPPAARSSGRALAAVSSAHRHSSGKLVCAFFSMDSTDREQANRPKASKEVQVTGTAEVRSPADRASVRVSLSSSKESVNEASSSISRRVEYILQAGR